MTVESLTVLVTSRENKEDKSGNFDFVSFRL
jgi:hypothetical protein